MNDKEYTIPQVDKLIKSNRTSIWKLAKAGKIDVRINPLNRRITVTQKGVNQLIAAFGKR